jgi:hypothetical protein
MERCSDTDRDSGVAAYEIGTDYIRVQFSGTSHTYTYSYRKAGSTHVENMKQLARNGSGLNSYINRHTKYLYD